jgi:hypothetical protein
MGVLYSNQFNLIFFVQLDTWFLYLIWIVFYVFCVVFYIVLFFCHATFSVLLYSSVLMCCSLLFILLCSSSCYVCVLVCIYCTFTLPPGVNPIAVNEYLSINLSPFLTS